MKTPRIYLSLATISGHEMPFIESAFHTNWLTTEGKNIDGFEEDIARFLCRNGSVVALNSGTSTIHMALIRCGVKPGDEVICQSLTFVATVNPVLYLGARPVFIDSERETWNLDPELLKESIEDRIRKTGRKPSAILVVDLYGMPAKMSQIQEIAAEYSIPLIDDAAEALGSYIQHDGEKYYAGTFGKFGCLSFNGNKIITASAGGALICQDEEEAGYIRFLASQAKDSCPWYEHSEVGYNYKISNICAGIGRGQIIRLEEYINKRRQINEGYRKELKNLSFIEFQNEPAGYFSNYWLTCILFPSEAERDKVRLALETENIENRILWKPMHLQPLYRHAPNYLNGISKELFKRGLCLPSGVGLTKDDMIRICHIIQKECVK